jgi:hypothetical protein
VETMRKSLNKSEKMLSFINVYIIIVLYIYLISIYKAF